MPYTSGERLPTHGLVARIRHNRSPLNGRFRRSFAAAAALAATAVVLVAVMAGPGRASGFNGRIAVVSAASGNDEIVSIAADGSAPVTLTTDPHADYDPAYSADGTRIAFVRQTDGGEFTLWTMNADGSHAVALTPPLLSARHPSWSPDGTRIVFERARGASGSNIAVIDAAGTGLHSIVTHAGSDREPAWSPGGARIAFTTDRYGGSDIVTVNADGTGLRRLTRDAASDRQATWSPDGATMAFVSNRTGADAIWAMTVAGGGQAQLVPASAGDHAPAYSADGSKIAFRRGSELWVANADGTQAARIPFAPTSDSAPSWQSVPAPDIAVSQTVLPATATLGGQRRPSPSRWRTTARPPRPASCSPTSCLRSPPSSRRPHRRVRAAGRRPCSATWAVSPSHSR